MARRCCLLLLLGVLGVGLGFQLRVPPALQPKTPPSPIRRVNTRKSGSARSSTSSTTGEQAVAGAAAAAAAAAARAPVQAHEGSTQGEEFLDWAKQWYPVLAVETTDAGRAHAVQLLAKDLVVWKDNKGTWSAFEDRCPHRAAPLTEGRVEKDGTLSCAYHGWRFDSDGKCLKIPQSEKSGRDEAQPAACAKVYPTQVAQGMIWVWGDNGPDAGLESALTPAALVPELNDEEAFASGRMVSLSPYVRDLPYAWETLMENLMDPAHTVVAHHGIIGDRDEAAPLGIKMTSSGLSKDGFSFEFTPPFVEAGAVKGAETFVAPSLALIDTFLEDGSKMKLVQYGVPTRPGWCRLMLCQMYIAAEDSKETETKKIIRVPGGLKPQHIPHWIQHLYGHLFLDQDMVLLHHQEKILDSGGYSSSNYAQGVFTPTESDKAVIVMRKWMAKYAPSGPVWGEGCDPRMPPRERNTDELFNIYERHTKGCTTCLGALKRVNQLLVVGKASAAISFAWAILRGARAVGGASASPSTSILNLVTARAMLPGVAMVFASLGSVKGLEFIHKAFHTSRYHHQDNE